MEDTRAGPMKRLLPRSLYGRATLILLLPVLFLLTVGTVVFVQRHYEDVTRQMTANVTLRCGSCTARRRPPAKAARRAWRWNGWPRPWR